MKGKIPPEKVVHQKVMHKNTQQLKKLLRVFFKENSKVKQQVPFKKLLKRSV